MLWRIRDPPEQDSIQRHTHVLSLRDLDSFLRVEWCGQSLRIFCNEILCRTVNPDPIRAPAIGCHRDVLPARSSNFSRPLILVAKTTSPVPIAPCFPFRRTRARVVVGLCPSASRLLWNLLTTTSFGPVVTRARELLEVGCCCLAAGFFGAILFPLTRCVDERTRSTGEHWGRCNIVHGPTDPASASSATR